MSLVSETHVAQSVTEQQARHVVPLALRLGGLRYLNGRLEPAVSLSQGMCLDYALTTGQRESELVLTVGLHVDVFRSLELYTAALFRMWS